MNSNNREKRTWDSSNAPKSFVQNVTSKMTELLPSTITKWFSGPGSSSANGSATVIEISDSSTEEEGLDSNFIPPPRKRMRRNSSVTNHFMDIETASSSTSTNAADVVQSPPKYLSNKCKYYKKGPEFMVMAYNGKQMNEMNKSTPKSSDPAKRVSEILKNALYSGDSLMAKTRKPFLNFSTAESMNEVDSHMDDYQSYNKSSLLGSTFYPGQTTYGGASNSPVNFKGSNILNKKSAGLNKSKTGEKLDISQTTKHIMDLLDSISSPVAEARRISQYVDPDKSISTSNANPDCKKVISYKTQELPVPNMASILSLKRKSRLIGTTSSARQIISSHSSSLNVSPYATKTKSPQRKRAKFVTKIKNTTRNNRADEINNIDTPASLDLPPAVLQIDENNLPNFAFASPISTSLAISNNSSPLHTSITSVGNISQPENGNLHNPIVLQSTSQNNELASTNTSNWKCNDCWVSNKPDVSKCVCCGGKKPVTEETKNCSVCLVKKCLETSDVCSDCTKTRTNNTSKCDLSKWKCNDCWVNNDSNEDKCVCCGGKKPSTLSEQNNTEFSSSTPMVGTSSKWKCEDCWVSNDAQADNCICCLARNPAKKIEVTKSTDKGWKCNVCMLDNVSQVANCIACLTSKPNPSSESNVPQNSSTLNFQSRSSDPLKKIMKSQSQKWECQYCLVHNDSDKSQCVCCDSEKPGATKQPQAKFNFGISPNTFKFGIDPTKTTEQAKVNENKSLVKETNNNELPKVALNFGIQFDVTDIADREEDQAKGNGESVAKAPALVRSTESTMPVEQTFSFGIPKETKTDSVINEVRANSSSEFASKSNMDINEKAQEVPNIERNESTNLQLSSPLFTNPTPPTVQTSQATATFATVSDNCVASTSSIPVTTSAGSAASSGNFFSPVSTAVASTPFIKPAGSSGNTELFQNNQPNKTGVNFITPPLFQKNTIQQPATSSLFQQTDKQNCGNATITLRQNTAMSLPEPSLFQQAEPAPTVPVSAFSAASGSVTSNPNLFSKNDPPTTTQAAGPSAPVFSFRSNNQMLQTEKPKLNYAFGTNRETNSNALAVPISGIFSSTPNARVAPNVVAPLSGNALQNSNNILSSISSGTIGGPSGGSGASSGNVLLGNSAAPTSGTNMAGPSVVFDISSESSNSRNDLPPLSPLSRISTPPTGLFGAAAPTDAPSVWTSSNKSGSSLFVTNPSSNVIQKPVSFSFGSNSMLCNINMINNTDSKIFGESRSETPNAFNPNTNNAPMSMFSSPAPHQNTHLFETSSLHLPNNQPTSGLFGQQNVNTPFGNAAQSSMPIGTTFNFGPTTPTGIFGFGQQSQQQQQQQQQQQLQQPQPQPQLQQSAVYNFGASATPQVQFSVGSAPNTTMRRMRKAVRRSTQR